MIMYRVPKLNLSFLHVGRTGQLHIIFEILVYGLCPLFFYNVIFLTAAGGRKFSFAFRCVECEFYLVFVFDIVIY